VVRAYTGHETHPSRQPRRRHVPPHRRLREPDPPPGRVMLPGVFRLQLPAL
jgi:hypothetical protein